MRKGNKGWQILRYLFLFAVIAEGLFSIVATGGNGSNDSGENGSNDNSVQGFDREIKFSFVSDDGTYEKYVWMAVPESIENNYDIYDVHYEPEPIKEQGVALFR